MIETLHGGAESYSRTELCRALGVSRSGLYDHRAKAQRPRRLQDKELAKEIELLFSQSRRTYGARRPPADAPAQGNPVWTKSLGAPHERAWTPGRAEAPVSP